MSLFEKIDNIFFEKVFQPISDWFSEKTGRTPHWIAATFAYLYGALIIWEALVYPPDSWTSYLWDGFMIFIIALIVISNERDDKNHKVGFANQYRHSISMRFLRIIGFAFLLDHAFHFYFPEVVVAEEVIACLRTFSFTCLLYFEACETKPPPPPKRSENLQPATVGT